MLYRFKLNNDNEHII